MDKKFHLDIITPTSIESFDNVSYLRIPSLDGLLGIQANHAKAIIGLDIGEIKISKDGKSDRVGLDCFENTKQVKELF